MSQTILIIEDEPKIAIGLQNYLESHGYSTLRAADGESGLRMARQEQPDLILLDVMLPKTDGFDVCRRLRAESAVPIIMLTARIEEADTLIGLELGADDYIAKPFSPRQVVARVKAVIRRSSGQLNPSEVIKHGDITLDIQRRNIQINNQQLDNFTPTEYDLLTVLIRNIGRPMTRSALLDAVRNHFSDAYDRTVDAHIKNLRRKIEPDPANPQYIITVFGIGYKFAEPI